MADFKIDKIKALLEQRRNDLGGDRISSLADIHPDIAEGFIAKIKNFIDEDPALIADSVPIKVRESMAVAGAHKKLIELGRLSTWEAKGKAFSSKLRTNQQPEETSALALSSSESGTTNTPDQNNQTQDTEKRKKHLAELGLDENASQEDIKKAYRKQMMEHHPDMAQNRNLSDEEKQKVHEKAISLNEAFAALYVASAASSSSSSVEGGTAQQTTTLGGPPSSGSTQQAGNFIFDFAKNKAQQYIQQPLQNVRNNLIKRFSKKAGVEITETAAKSAVKAAAKTAAKTAVKEGVKTGIKVGAESLAAATGPGVVFAIAIEVVDRLWQAMSKGIKKFLSRLNGLISSITGTNDRRENFAYALLAGGGMLMLGGLAVPGAAVVGTGAIIGARTGAAASLVTAVLFIPKLVIGVLAAAVTTLFVNTVLAIVLILVGTVLIYTIIQMGAYVVPQGGFGTQTEYTGIHGGQPPQGYPGGPFPTLPPFPPGPTGGPLPPAGYFGDGENCEYTTPFPNLEAYTCQHGAGVTGMVGSYMCIGAPIVAPFDGCVWPYNDDVGGVSVIIWPDDPSGDYQDQDTSNCPSIYITHLSDTVVSGERNELGCIPVSQGQLLGHAGCTGSCWTRRTPPHAHIVCSSTGNFIYNADADVNCVDSLGNKTNLECNSYAEITQRIRNEPIECLLHPYN